MRQNYVTVLFSDVTLPGKVSNVKLSVFVCQKEHKNPHLMMSALTPL